jgi:hypothetical protein
MSALAAEHQHADGPGRVGVQRTKRICCGTPCQSRLDIWQSCSTQRSGCDANGVQLQYVLMHAVLLVSHMGVPSYG